MRNAQKKEKMSETSNKSGKKENRGKNGKLVNSIDTEMLIPYYSLPLWHFFAWWYWFIYRFFFSREIFLDLYLGAKGKLVLLMLYYYFC